MKLQHTIILTVLLAGWLSNVSADTLEAESDKAIPVVEDLLFQEIDSVYTASKYDQKVTKAPSRVSIITAEEIQRYGYRTMEDILKSLPGFYSANDRNYVYTGVRGFSSPGDYDTKVLMLVDGHRLNDNVYDTIYTDYGFILDLDLIERIEIIRGPGSSLYGSNAFFGVINVITRNGRALQGVEFSASYGSYDTYSGRLSYGNRFTNGMELIVSGSYFDSNGETDIYYQEFDTPSTNYGVARDVDDTQRGNLFGKLSYKDFILTGAWVEMEKGIPTGSYETVFNDSRNRTWDGQAYLDLKYQKSVSETVTVNGRIAYDWYWYSGDYVYDYGPPPDIVINQDDARGEWGTIEANATWDTSENNRLIAGGEYRDSQEQTQDNYDVYGTYLDVDNDIDTWGLYAQDEFSASDQVSFNLGVRYDGYSTGESTINPRLAGIYTPHDGTAFKLLYGTAYRAQNAFELYYEDDGFSQKTNDNLQPEEITSYELVAEHRFNSNIRASASAFYNDIDNLIVLTLDPADDLLFYDNLGSAIAKGIEVDLTGRWSNGWITTLSYTYQNAEDGDDQWLVNSPKYMAKINLMFPLLAGDILSGALDMQYMSKRLTIGGNETDDTYVTNLVFTSRNIVERLTVTLAVYNIFDEEYAYPVSEAHLQDSIEQPGRSVLLTIDLVF